MKAPFAQQASTPRSAAVVPAAPDLVVFDKDGAPQTVRYHFVNAMLLNEVQKQQLNREQRVTIQQQTEIQELAARLMHEAIQLAVDFASSRD